MQPSANTKQMGRFVTWVKTHLLQFQLGSRGRSPRLPLYPSGLSCSESAPSSAGSSDFRSLSSGSQAASSTTDNTASAAEIHDALPRPAQPGQRPEQLTDIPVQEVSQHVELSSLPEEHPHREEALSLRPVAITLCGASDEAETDCGSETSTLCSEASSAWGARHDPPCPMPTNVEEWFKTFTCPKASLRFFYPSLWPKRMAEFHQSYPLFDFSSPQIIDMELSAEEQCVYIPRKLLTAQRPLDVQIYFTIIGMVLLFGPEKEIWTEVWRWGRRDGGSTFHCKWVTASAEERHSWLSLGSRLLRERLANGTAITYPSHQTTSNEPFPWADSRLSSFPQNFSWVRFGSFWEIAVDGEERLSPEEESKLCATWSDPIIPAFRALDRYNLHGAVFLSNIRIPLPLTARESDWSTFSAVWTSYQEGHPGYCIEWARSQLNMEWDLEEEQPEIDLALRAMLLLHLCKSFSVTCKTLSVERWLENLPSRKHRRLDDMHQGNIRHGRLASQIG